LTGTRISCIGCAPQASICFNTTLADIAKAKQRWIAP
jgi:hypothetical protein